MSDKIKTLNGILCSHNIPVHESEGNSDVLFLHNEAEPLGKIIKILSSGKKIAISYYVSDTYKTENEAMEFLIKKIHGYVDTEIMSSGHPYSEVTPDICWTHENEFRIGGHDMNRELSSYVGKWIIIWLSINEG